MMNLSIAFNDKSSSWLAAKIMYSFKKALDLNGEECKIINGD